jgi:hypothetical protein
LSVFSIVALSFASSSSIVNAFAKMFSCKVMILSF